GGCRAAGADHRRRDVRPGDGGGGRARVAAAPARPAAPPGRGAVRHGGSGMTGRTGVIHDIGYQRYQGVRHGRAAIGRALFWHSLRTAFGFGRGAKAKIFPWLVSGVVLITAVVFTALHTT